MALGLSSPWFVESSEILEGELHLRINFKSGSKFDGCAVHDTSERTWRHLNFWQYPTYLHARVPRVIGEDGKVGTVDIPWARAGSGFTAMFEALAMLMVRSMPVSEVSRVLHVDDMALWRLMERSVETARQKVSFEEVTRIGVDETSCKKRHDYVTEFVDLDRTRVLFCVRGKGAHTLEEFEKEFTLHGGKVENVKTFSCDMSKAFLAGIREHFPKAQVVLDRFHLVKLLNEAVDQTRKSETHGHKSHRFVWLRNPASLTEEQVKALAEMEQNKAYEKTSKAYRLRLAFQNVFVSDKKFGIAYFDSWLDEALSSGIEAIERVAQTFFNMRDNIISWFDHRVNNGILEGINSVIQSAKARARGYANPNHMILMSYILHGKLDFSSN